MGWKRMKAEQADSLVILDGSCNFTYQLEPIAGEKGNSAALGGQNCAGSYQLRHACKFIPEYENLRILKSSNWRCNWRFSQTSAKEVDEAVAKASIASEHWASLSFRKRGIILRDWASLLTREIESSADLIHRETGKPLSDARLEVSIAIEHIGWAAKYAPKVLSDQSRPSGLLMFNMAAKVQRSPFGVIGIIGPWNYPFFTPVGSIAYALAAGNTVVFKPSEFTPAVGAWLGES